MHCGHQALKDAEVLMHNLCQQSKCQQDAYPQNLVHAGHHGLLHGAAQGSRMQGKASQLVHGMGGIIIDQTGLAKAHAR